MDEHKHGPRERLLLPAPLPTPAERRAKLIDELHELMRTYGAEAVSYAADELYRAIEATDLAEEAYWQRVDVETDAARDGVSP